MDAVLLFSGQGAQKVGMGKDLYDQYPAARALIEQADKALGESLSSIMFEGPGEELTRTCNCQPALYVHGLACLAVLKELAPSLNPVPAFPWLNSRLMRLPEPTPLKKASAWSRSAARSWRKPATLPRAPWPR
mgnify:FL=1